MKKKDIHPEGFPEFFHSFSWVFFFFHFEQKKKGVGVCKLLKLGIGVTSQHWCKMGVLEILNSLNFGNNIAQQQKMSYPFVKCELRAFNES